MKVHIHGHNLKVADSLAEFTHQKVDRLDRYLPNISEVNVELAIQHSNRGPDLAIAQITVRHSRGAILRAEERLAIEDHNTIRSSIMGALDKLYRQIERFKNKRRTNKRLRERYVATLEEINMAEALPEMEADGASEAEAEGIVRRKAVAVSAMNEEEAIHQMELLDHSFFVFFNTETNGINVIYKRKSGGYGVLIPQLEG